MKYFKIQYKRGGQTSNIVINGNHKLEAIKSFQEAPLGLFVSIKEVSEPLSIRFKKFNQHLSKISFKGKVDLESYIASLRQLEVMLDASIPITHSLEEIVNTTDNKQLKTIFSTIAKDVDSGMGIAESFDKFSSHLGALSASIISLGEQTGSLGESVGKLADILEEIHENKKKLKKALRYPMIVSITMVIAFTAIIKLVVPQFKEMFSEVDTELPLPTQMLLGIEEFIQSSGLLILGTIFTTIIVHKFLYSSNKNYKYFVDKYILKIYLLGKVTKLSITGRYIYVFDKLTHAGVPITDALTIATNIIENDYLKERFGVIREYIEEGRSLHEGFEESGQFESMILQMIQAGERGGALNKMLEKVDKYYTTKYNDLIDNLSSYIEPIMIFFIAGFLLMMALGIFLPMWSMADALDS